MSEHPVLDQVFANISDDAILENVPQPWIFAMLSAVNTETATEGRHVTLNSKSTIADMKRSILALNYEAQFQILSRTFTRYTTDMKESSSLNDSLRSLEHDRLKNKLIAASVYTFLVLIVIFVLATIGITVMGVEGTIDEKLGTTLFSTLMELINLVFSAS